MRNGKIQTLASSLMILLICGVCAMGQAKPDLQAGLPIVSAAWGMRVAASAEDSGEPQSATVRFISREIGFDSKVIAGAPFSADVVTEFTQVLSNGQRIHRKSTSPTYRDSEGRTRREQTISVMLDSYGSSPQKYQMIIINDPVAHVQYELHPSDHTATKRMIDASLPGTKTSTNEIRVIKSPDGTEEKTVQLSGSVAGGVGLLSGQISQKIIAGGEVAGIIGGFAPGDVRKEQLGTQVIEGVQADGARVVETIPAGAIGNDTPIEITTETWTSPELGIVIKTVHNDPRSGENVYQLINIRRGDPPAALFQVPSDYTIKEGSPEDKVFFQIKK